MECESWKMILTLIANLFQRRIIFLFWVPVMPVEAINAIISPLNIIHFTFVTDKLAMQQFYLCTSTGVIVTLIRCFI